MDLCFSLEATIDFCIMHYAASPSWVQERETILNATPALRLSCRFAAGCSVELVSATR